MSGAWPGVRQGFRLERVIRRGVKTTTEVVHGITSLPPEQADAAALLAAVRSHWRVENQLHYVRDVSQGEDACRVRTGAGPQVLAACRNAVVRLWGMVAATVGIAQAAVAGYLAAQPAAAIDCLKAPG